MLKTTCIYIWITGKKCNAVNDSEWWSYGSLLASLLFFVFPKYFSIKSKTKHYFETFHSHCQKSVLPWPMTKHSSIWLCRGWFSSLRKVHGCGRNATCPLPCLRPTLLQQDPRPAHSVATCQGSVVLWKPPTSTMPLPHLRRVCQKHLWLIRNLNNKHTPWNVQAIKHKCH